MSSPRARRLSWSWFLALLPPLVVWGSSPSPDPLEANETRVAAVPRDVDVPEAGSGLKTRKPRRSPPGIFFPEAGSTIRPRRVPPATVPRRPRVAPQPARPAPRGRPDPRPRADDPRPDVPSALPEAGSARPSTVDPRPTSPDPQSLPEAGSVIVPGGERPETGSGLGTPTTGPVSGRPPEAGSEVGSATVPPESAPPAGYGADVGDDDPTRRRFRDLWGMAGPLLIFLGGLATAFCLVQLAGRREGDASLDTRRLELACDLVERLDAVLLAGFERDWDRFRTETIALTGLNGRRLLLFDDRVNQAVTEFLEEAVQTGVIRARAGDLATLRDRYAAVLAGLRATVLESGESSSALSRLLADSHEMTRRVCVRPS